MEELEINEKDLQLVITKQELGALETNALAVKEKVQEILKKYDLENYKDKDPIVAKNDRAVLNKTAKVLDEKRLEVERKFMEPINPFKGIIKETIEMITKASSQIDTIVKEAENREKEEKKKAILVIFESEVKELKDIVKFEDIFDERYLNKTFKIEDVEKDITSKLEQIRNDLITISELHSKYEIELKNDYLKHFDLGLIIRKNSELMQKEELLKNQTSETEKIIEEAKEEKMQKMSEQVVEAKEEEPILTFTLKITGKKNQLIALRKFIEVNGMNYEKIN